MAATRGVDTPLAAGIQLELMENEQIRKRLTEACGFGEFEARARPGGDTLFLAAHRSRPRVLLTMEAREDFPEAIEQAVETAIGLFKGQGHDVIIRRNESLTDLDVVREAIRPSL